MRDQFCVKPGETVLITADTQTNLATAESILSVARMIGAEASLLVVNQLPYQGRLADPYIPEILKRAVLECDVWLDMAFPYLAGSEVHDDAMSEKRCRYLLLGDLSSRGIENLYGRFDLDVLFSFQNAFDNFIAEKEGAKIRITSPLGTDVSFELGRSVAKKIRHSNVPGMYTPPGSGIFFPVPESVKGEIILESVFHEYYVQLPSPMRIKLDGSITSIDGGGAHAQAMDRALRRAAGGEYGRVIHFSYGFHPMTQFTGHSFIEDIRVCGTNAIGFGVPWWEPGGGENHPDGVITQQSLWIEDEQVICDGVIKGPKTLLSPYLQMKQADSR
ncbi:hypothetical protein [uncultured Sneathiella sp.]|uniref:hypothetical protein n=1 Tax=uncultured Sneathiella sp. TaxID=879315 RepID=UPI0030EE2169